MFLMGDRRLFVSQGTRNNISNSGDKKTRGFELVIHQKN